MSKETNQTVAFLFETHDSEMLRYVKDRTLSKHFQDPLLGRSVGQVELLEKIGSGGMGVVYRARHKLLETEQAVKILHPHYASNQKILERFRREALAIRSLNHPNVVSVMDFGWEEGIGAYQVMELLRGESLAQALQHKQIFSKRRLLNLAEQIASVLSQAHQNRILHRDLKPDNIFLCAPFGDREVIKVLDFGIAKVLQEFNNKLTSTGVALGTPYYMSPEQAGGRWEQVDHRTDIYAFGVLLFEIIAGEPPLAKGHIADILLKQVHGEVRFLHELRPELAGHDIERVLAWCFSLDRAKRPASIENLMQYLRPALDALPEPPKQTFAQDTMAMDSLFSSSQNLPSSSSPHLRHNTPHSHPENFSLGQLSVERLQQLRQIAPSLFGQENLMGSVSCSSMGHILNKKGKFPENYAHGVLMIDGIVQQIQSAMSLQHWELGVLETDQHVIGIFPQQDGVGGMLFGQAKPHTSMALDPFQGHAVQQERDPISQIRSVTGVEELFLFGAGQLAYSSNENKTEQQKIQRLFIPVWHMLESLPFPCKGLDFWFPTQRILFWNLGEGSIVLRVQRKINRLMLSVMLGRQFKTLQMLCHNAIVQPPHHFSPAPQSHPPPSNSQSALERIPVTTTVRSHHQQQSTSENMFAKAHSVSSSSHSGVWEEDTAFSAPASGIPTGQIISLNDDESEEILQTIQDVFTTYMGPMAKLLIKKSLKKMGYTRKTLPRREALALVRRLAERLKEPKRSQFLNEGMESLARFQI